MEKIQTFSQAQTYLESLLPDTKESVHYIKPGLGRMRALLDLLGNPQNKYPTIHIGGTAGKGSTATIIANTLSTAGYKTGLHISPHLQDVRERMQIDRGLPSEDEFVSMVNDIRPIVEKVGKNSGFGSPSYFEVLLALAFQYFAREKVDIAVIEVGLGGTLDGTNVIAPICSVLTNVELDHTEILGDTVEKIAQDKVGIFKKGIPVISGVTQPSVRQIVEENANVIGSPLQFIDEHSYTISTLEENGSDFDISLPDFSLEDVHLSLLGRHQVQNAVVSTAVFQKIKNAGFLVNEEAIRKSFGSISIPGRAEIIKDIDPRLFEGRNNLADEQNSEEDCFEYSQRRNSEDEKGSKLSYPTLILDGAHNPAKMRAFVEAINTIFPGKKCQVIFAVKKGKNVAEMLSVLDEITDKYSFTTFLSATDFGRNQAMDPNEIKKLTKKPSEVFSNSTDALNQSTLAANPDDIILITGSLFLVGELRSFILPSRVQK